MTIDPEKPIFKTADIADIIGMTPQFVRDQVKAGLLRCSFQSKGSSYVTYRFSLNDVLAYDRDAAERLAKSRAA